MTMMVSNLLKYFRVNPRGQPSSPSLQLGGSQQSTHRWQQQCSVDVLGVIEGVVKSM